MGAASTEIEFHARGRTIHLAITSARLELTRGQTGNVLVVEDTTELLRAQRQLAWKEVAQRVAHEIKNPLTPIALSAERIGRHLERGQPDSPNVIRKCSEVILACVGTLRSLVDQFSALAQFPAPQPRACDMNKIAEEALALFAGRLEGITVQRESRSRACPPVLADPDALRRALANLIDNAAEAMQGSLLRLLGIQHRAQRRWRRRRSHRLRHRPRPHRRNPRAALSALLLHQASRHRPRPFHRRQNRAGARRLHSRRGQQPQGRALPAAPAAHGARRSAGPVDA